MEGCWQFGAETVEEEGWFINLPYHPPCTCPLFSLFLSPKRLFKILSCHLFQRSHASFCFSIIPTQSISLSLASPQAPFALSPREACWQILGWTEMSASIHSRLSLSLSLISYLFPFSSASFSRGSVTFSLSYRGRQAGVTGKQHASLPVRGTRPGLGAFNRFRITNASGTFHSTLFQPTGDLRTHPISDNTDNWPFICPCVFKNIQLQGILRE